MGPEEDGEELSEFEEVCDFDAEVSLLEPPEADELSR